MSDIKHLLIPKEFKVYCLPSRSADSLSVTNEPSKATCANCLTIFRRGTTGRRGQFKVSHTPDTRRKSERDDSGQRCAVCGGRIYQESAAEGFTCTQCGASDSDE